MIQIKKEDCQACGKCKRLCPMGIIAIIEKKAFVEPEGHCIKCGHCQAVCEFNAIVLHENEQENGQEVYKAVQNVAFADLSDCIMSNRSIRNYKDTLVDKEAINTILRTLDYTASAKNEQKVKWIVVSTKEKVEEIYQMCLARLRRTAPNHPLFKHLEEVRNAVTLDAPHLLIAYAEKESAMPLEDCMIKTSFATLLMHTLGIGSCFLGFLEGFINTNKQLKELLKIAENEKVYAVLGFGYNNNEVYVNVPSRKRAEIRFID